MTLHKTLADKLHLLEGISSFEAALADPVLAPRLAEFMSTGVTTPPAETTIKDAQAPGPHGPVPVRIYTPITGEARMRPALVWVHGGAFRIGSIDNPETDQMARGMCAQAGAVVVSVDYRLAVDGVCYPVPHDDVVAALRWVLANAATLSIDPSRISVGGDSAGANLAAGATLKLRDGGWTPAALLLAYPVMHPVLPPLSVQLSAAVNTLPNLLRFLPHTVADMNRNYLGRPESSADGYAMPGLAILDGLCPTVVVNAEYDDLRASGESFVAAAAQAGVDVHQVTARGMLHGFLMWPDTIEPAARTRELFATTIRNAGRLAEQRETDESRSR